MTITEPFRRSMGQSALHGVLLPGGALLLSAALATLPYAALGQEGAAPTLEEVMVVSGSRLPGSLADLPAHVSVIDRSTIEARQDSSVVELLRSAAGLHVSQYGGRGGVSSVFLRGAEPNFTAVYIDGVKVNDPNNTRGGSFDFSTINLAEVERVEVIRGAQSAVYGSDGLAGIINIITRDTNGELAAAIDGEVGQDDYWRTAVHLTGGLGAASQWSLSGTASDDGNALDGNSFDNKSINGRLSSQPTEALTIDLAGRYADTNAESFPEDSGGPELAVIREVDDRDQDQLSLSGGFGYDISERWTLNAQVGYLEHDENFTSPGVADGVRPGVPPNRSDSNLKRFNASTHTLFSVNDIISSSFGVSWEDEEGDLRGAVEFFPGFAAPTDFDLDRQVFGAFGEIRFDWPAGASLTAALRHDEPDEESGQTTGRIAAQYRHGNTRVFASWSEGYKLPSFFALGNALVGNPQLDPETSTTWELGLSQSLLQDAMELTVTGFSTEYKDLIDFDFDLFLNVNRNQVDTDGFELAASYQLQKTLSLQTHLTYVDIDVDDSTVRLRQRPNWRGGVTAFWSMGRSVSLMASWLYVDESFDSSIPTGPDTLGSYNRLDAKIDWQPTSNLTVWLAVDNLLDESYEEAIGFPALDARARLGMRLRL